MIEDKSTILTGIQIQIPPIHTIAKDKNFKINSQNKIFYTYSEKNAEILSYIFENKNLYVFAEDKFNETTKKISKLFFAMDWQTVYNLAIQHKYSLYEYFDVGQKVKLFIDIDMKKEDNPFFPESENDRLIYLDNPNYTKEIIENYGMAIQYLHPLNRTPELIKLAINNDIHSLIHCEMYENLDKELYKHPEFIAKMINYIPEDIIEKLLNKKGMHKYLMNEKMINYIPKDIIEKFQEKKFIKKHLLNEKMIKYISYDVIENLKTNL